MSQPCIAETRSVARSQYHRLAAAPAAAMDCSDIFCLGLIRVEQARQMDRISGTNAGQTGMLGISPGLCMTTTRSFTFDHFLEPVNKPQKAELALEVERQNIPGHDPRKQPTRQPGDGYVLVGALVGVTAGAALGVAVGLATAAYIAIIGGVVTGGVIGAILGKHIKRRITKRSRAERQP